MFVGNMKHSTDYSQLTIESESKISQAMKQMDTAHRILLIVMNRGKFLSLLSIGDIQRAISKASI